jgi:hypothetical protein
MAKSIPLDNNYVGVVVPSQYHRSYYFYINYCYKRKDSREMTWGEFKKMYPFSYGYQYCRGRTEKEMRK